MVEASAANLYTGRETCQWNARYPTNNRSTQSKAVQYGIAVEQHRNVIQRRHESNMKAITKVQEQRCALPF